MHQIFKKISLEKLEESIVIFVDNLDKIRCTTESIPGKIELLKQIIKMVL